MGNLRGRGIEDERNGRELQKENGGEFYDGAEELKS